MAKPAPPEPKFRRRAEDRPDEVLDAALKLFVEGGYAATSVAQIAKAAGLSKGAVYLYFPSKQAILEGLVRRAVAPVSAQALQQVALAKGDLKAALSGLFRTMSASLADPKVFAIPKIVMHEAVQAPEIAQMYRRAVLDMAMPALANAVRAGVDAGQLRPVDPELTVRSIVGPIMLHIVLAEVFGITPDAGLRLPDLIDNHLDILFHGLLAGPAKGINNA